MTASPFHPVNQYCSAGQYNDGGHDYVAGKSVLACVWFPSQEGSMQPCVSHTDTKPGLCGAVHVTEY